MTQPQKTILFRFLRALGAVVVAFLASFAMSEDFLGLVPNEYDNVVVLFVAPALLALEKFLRDGGDARS